MAAKSPANGKGDVDYILLVVLGLGVYCVLKFIIGVDIPLWMMYAICSLPFVWSSIFRGAGKSGSVGKDAFPLNGLAYIQGNPVTISPGNVIVVEFWATWCPPCRATIPHLNQLYQKFKARGVEFVGITRENSDKVKPFILKMGKDMTYPIAQDVSSQVSNEYPSPGIPNAFVIGKDAKIAWVGHPAHGLDKAIKDALDAADTSKAS